MFRLIFTVLMAVFFSAETWAQSESNKTNPMKVAVWDTYVKKKDGRIMHFDIVAPEHIKDPSIIHSFGKKYLTTKGQEGQSLTSKECRFCHLETLRTEWKDEIQREGFFIIEMENCD